LEGVMAHEISHIRNYDIRLMSIVSVMVGLLALLADWFLRMGLYGRGNRNEKNQLAILILILGLIFAIISPIIAKLIQLAISRRREFMADGGSVELTRQPSGLIAALEKISADHEPLEAANKATAHLFIVNPFKDKSGRAVEKLASLFNTHPPMGERIKALQNML
jgi:heat shock protein HtpX